MWNRTNLGTLRNLIRQCMQGAALVLMIGLPASTLAQETDFWEQRPGGRNLVPQDYAHPAPGLTLPNSPASPGQSPLSAQERFIVRRFELTGNTVFSSGELVKVTDPYLNRAVTPEELQDVRRQLTLYYVDRGYLNSGAVIPDQPAKEGVVQIRIIEGQLSQIEVSGNRHLSGDYFRDRLRSATDEPLNVDQLQNRLQLLQQNPLLEQLQAELTPGIQQGESVLQLGVQEASPYEIGLAVANNNPPSVGATRAYLYGLDRNLTGVGDSLGLSYGHSLEGSTADWRVFYARPVTSQDTTVMVWADQNETSVIEDRFDTLDITSKLESYGASLTHPLYRTLQETFSLGMALERRHSESYLLGIPFSFAPGEHDGQATVAVGRFVQEWLDRQVNQVIAARSTFSFGFDAFGATLNDGGNPDTRFMAWLGQFQWARRFGERDYQLIAKANMQLTDQPLLPMEKCALGGMDTVRGYPENTMVRDECFNASVEFRAPVYLLPIAGISRSPTDGQVQLAAFTDYGYAKNKGEFDLNPNLIYSAGLGVRWEPSLKVRTALYWGYPFREVNLGDTGGLSPRVNFVLQAAY